MRTTLDIDDDVLGAVKDLARSERKSAGKVLSDLARRALTPREEEWEVKNGFPQVPGKREIVTTELVQGLLDEDEMDSVG